MKKYLKAFYEAIPLKPAAYKVLRTFIRLPHRLHAYFYFKGVFTTRVEGRSFKMMNYGYQYHVENEYFWGGIENGWEKYSTDLWIKLCRNADVILDVGANTGCFSLIAKTVKPQATIHAFEPMDSIYHKLRKNVDLNSFDIHTHPVALSDFAGEAKIYPTSLDHVYSVTVNENMFKDQQVFEQTIQVRRLDALIEELGIGKIDLMKIDVETHEVHVLKGMGKYLRQFQPDFLIEIQTDAIAAAVEEMLKGLDYVYFNINEEKGVRKTDSLSKSDWLNYLVCHRSTAQSIGLLN